MIHFLSQPSSGQPVPAGRRRWNPGWLSLLLPLFLTGCVTRTRAPRAEAPQAPSGAFTEVTRAAGINSRHHRPVLDHQLDNIMSWVTSVGAAAAAVDYNNDGWMDLYVTDSRKGYPNHLYRNNGDGTFTDVAEQAGLAWVNTEEKGVSMDCVWCDYDNDGWPDLFLVRWGVNSLFHNNGNGTFTEVTDKLFRKRDGSPGMDWANGCAAIFLDYNMDGRPDIFVGNYFTAVDLWHLKSTRIMHNDFEKGGNAGRNRLYRQNADGTFTEVAHELGLDDPAWTLSVGAADLNNDGWPDIYCANDFGPDQLFLNNKQGGFTNITATAIGFDTKKGMNVDFGDFDNDGWLDIYVANITTAEYLQEGNMLWHNNGVGPDGNLTFTDISLETGTYDGGWGWGAKFFDADNDGRLDIIAVNGFVSAGPGNYWYDLATWTVKGPDVADAKNWPAIGDRSFSGYEKDRFFHNDGNYTFSERAHEYGLDSTRDGRGVVCFDYNNHGYLDVFIANQDQAPQLFRNNLGSITHNHWLMVRLIGDPKTGITRDALGARVTIVTAAGRQMRENNGGKCYCGQSDPRLHFGLGGENHVKLLEVRWPDGGLQYLENVAADRLLTIRQNPALYASKLALSQPPPKPWQRAAGRDEHVVPKIGADDLNRLLSEMEARLRVSLDTFKPASTYRARCADYDQQDRAIKFFSELVAAQTNNVRARIELSCAYVDKIPTCGGMAAIVSKGTLARKALDQMDAVIKTQPDSWVAHYTRGMNHLYWPRALRHSQDATVDFTRCIELQEQRGAGKPKPYYLLCYVALGDAYAKDGKPDKARHAWRQGLKLFPAAAELKTRLAIEDNAALLKFVENRRSLDQPIDTDLTFLDREP
jgi:tetratricopeptide (TPR) repeat protein